jgi:phospholipid transport system substrate-binding protein
MRVARAALAALTMMLAAALAGAPARAATPAERFVQTNIEHGLSILNDKAISDAKRRSEFRRFLIGLTDIQRTALFTLGAARRTASAAEVNAFVDAFRDYAIAVYQARLSTYSGQSLKVTGSTERAPGDYVVTTVLVDPNHASDQDPIQVDFRVDSKHGKFVVLDASVVGVWLAIEERDQFTAFLAQNNNSVPKLTHHLRELTAKLERGAPPQTNGG